MLNDLIKICKILPYSSDDADYISTHYQDFALEVIEESAEQTLSCNVPTLIIGWSKVKELYPEQSILSSKISENLFWTFSLTEK